jgi:hypothetical protein
MLRRSCVSAFALAAVFVLGGVLMGRPSVVTAQPPAQRKCVGVAAAAPGGFPWVYRAFEDGTVEVFVQTDNRSTGKWQQVGK